MADVPTTERPAIPGPTAASGRARRGETGAPRSRPASGLTTYYRLRTLALQARVAALEAKVDRTERRLQETIQQYEDILQSRPDEGSVVTSRPPAPDGG